MIDHLGLPVSDMAKSKKFYEAALKPLGYVTVMDFGEAAGLGAGGRRRDDEDTHAVGAVDP